MRADRSYLVTGGLGDLGLRAASWLAAHGARTLVLVGRQGAARPEAQRQVARLRAEGIDVRVVAADVSLAGDVKALLAEIDASPAPLGGLVHAAGVLEDVRLAEMDRGQLARVLAPKVAGAWALHEATRGRPLDLFVLFGSFAGTIGSPGQANHAAANAFLDALAHHRHALGLPALSIAWGVWGDIGAAARVGAVARARRYGLEPLPSDRALEALDVLLQSGVSAAAAAPLDPARLLAALGNTPFLSALRPAVVEAPRRERSGVTARLAASPASERLALLRAHVGSEVARVLGSDLAAPLDPARGFFDLGMDSLTSVELVQRLQASLEIALPSTLAFQHPTVEALSLHLLGQLPWDEPAPAAIVEPVAPRAQDTRSEAIAIVGLGCRIPGGVADADGFWRLLSTGADAVREVPPERWDVDAYYDADPEAPGKISTRFGAFLDGIDQFDASFFGISPREAATLDPQQRLLLETSWEALEDAGIAPSSLSGRPVGVYVGISHHDYAQLLWSRHVDAIDPYLGTGTAHSVASGRLSYVLGLRGPSLAVDTACSSSL
ncbi:MAG TPA: SDR family NAD(P)-dependent oxidoreductase, partial [Vicinamibacteria bacterium]|nr:SDR family NAD(P)-dependent oxidoreductase [Vicinamibacteria bacterium]